MSKFCSKCGKELLDEAVICPECGSKTSAEFENIDEPKNNNMGATLDSMEQKVQAFSERVSKRSVFFPVGGIISGIISIIFGVVMFFKDVGAYEFSSTYGGDAYTGIQNAAAQTANNVKALSEITRMGDGFLLIVLGLIAIFYFASQIQKQQA